MRENILKNNFDSFNCAYKMIHSLQDNKPPGHFGLEF